MFAASKSGKAVAAGATTDQYFKNTVLLLNDTGTNGAQNNTFVDSSTNNFTITRNGNATQGSVNPYEPTGYWSGNFSGSSQYLTVSTNSAFTYGTNDFTIECWIFLTTTGVLQYIVDQRNSGTANAVIPAIYVSASNVLTYFVSNAAQITGTTALVIGTWYHVAVSRGTLNTKMFLNGTQEGSTYVDANNYAASRVVISSNAATAGNYLTGFISNIRLVNGTALYTSSFTPPTIPLTAITNTSLLTLQNNRFIDNSSNNFSITATGTPISTSFNPFPPTASYSGATYGGSMYFDGNGDYLQTPTNSALAANSTSYTIEAWVYADMATFTVFDYGRGIASDYLTNSSGRWLLWINNTGYLSFSEQDTIGSNDVTITDSVAFPLRQWVHVMGVKSGTTMYLFKNGASVTTATSASRTGFQGRLNVGEFTEATSYRGYFIGYISNLRFLVGTALYTSSFTPPTAPVSAITNTKLLLNATNAGIYDATDLNDMETVGSTQVSTTQYKWSPSSMKFNGTTDYLTITNTNNLNFGTGDFTVEFWMYPTTITFQMNIIATSGAFTTNSTRIGKDQSFGMCLYSNNGTSVIVSEGNNTFISGAANIWTYYAFVRSGNNFTLYRNGTSVGTGTSSFAVTLTLNNATVVGTDWANDYFTGYIDDLRITKGVARYTANFTPPTAAFQTR